MPERLRFERELDDLGLREYDQGPPAPKPRQVAVGEPIVLDITKHPRFRLPLGGSHAVQWIVPGRASATLVDLKKSPLTFHWLDAGVGRKVKARLTYVRAGISLSDEFVYATFDVKAPPPTVGFEFDVHFGLMPEIVADAGKTMPANNSEVTKHTEASDFFRVKLDGTRLEIATKPFTVNDEGKKELEQAITNILAFANKLKKACEGAAERSIVVPGVTGKPRPFTLSDTVAPGLPIVRLPVNKRFDPKECSVWASPQATITVSLSKMAALVQEIRSSQGKGAGRALTGSSNVRLGVRSDALFQADSAVRALWNALASRKPKLILSDSTEVNAKTLSNDLRGLVILLASYLWTGELKYNYPPPDAPGKDYEQFAKAYLPINVKAPFSEIFREVLTDTERLLFTEVFAAKGAARERFFRLARPKEAKPDGTKLLFPTGPKIGAEDSVHKFQKDDFGTAPTWDDLVEHTLNKDHHTWGDRLMVPSYRTPPKPSDDASKIIGMDKTKPRVALELRRIGFAAVFSSQWPGFMRQVFAMTKKLDA